MRHNTPAERKARSQLMIAHSWPQRLEELSEIVAGAIRPAGCDCPAGPASRAETREPQLQIA
jgi:hypothetical protein